MRLQNYSRIFNALFPHDSLIKSAVVVYLYRILLLILIVFTCVSLYFLSITYMQYVSVSSQKISDTNKLLYWERVIKSHPTFPAAYFEAAVFSAKANNYEKAIGYLKKSLLLDPNFSDAELFIGKLIQK